MSHIRFDGQGAGLGKQLGGNANSLTDYTLICTCKSELGPVAGFRANTKGERTVYCLKCKHITILSEKDGRVDVAGYVPAPQEIVEKAAKQTVVRIAGKV